MSGQNKGIKKKLSPISSIPKTHYENLTITILQSLTKKRGNSVQRPATNKLTILSQLEQRQDQSQLKTDESLRSLQNKTNIRTRSPENNYGESESKHTNATSKVFKRRRGTYLTSRQTPATDN